MKVVKEGELVRVELDAEERSLPLDKLCKLLSASGYPASRATVWRAKKRGHFFLNFNPGKIGERVYLTEE
jgi:hypothetical protein